MRRTNKLLRALDWMRGLCVFLVIQVVWLTIRSRICKRKGKAILTIGPVGEQRP